MMCVVACWCVCFLSVDACCVLVVAVRCLFSVVCCPLFAMC